VREARQLSASLTIAAVLIGATWWASGGRLGPPRGVLLIDALLSFALLGGVRGLLRARRERRLAGTTSSAGDSWIRVGIVGAGEMGAWVATELALQSGCRRRVEALFDDDPNKWHKRLHGILVAGMPECILEGTWRNRLDEVIVAMPEATPERVQQVRAFLSRAHIPARTLPSLKQILAG
jgi:FlaA1/EpsC-like NDP-sugar epimerase